MPKFCASITFYRANPYVVVNRKGGAFMSYYGGGYGQGCCPPPCGSYGGVGCGGGFGWIIGIIVVVFILLCLFGGFGGYGGYGGQGGYKPSC